MYRYSEENKYYICLYRDYQGEKYVLSHNPLITLKYLNTLLGAQKILFFNPPMRLAEAFEILKRLNKLNKLNKLLINPLKSIIKFWGNVKRNRNINNTKEFILGFIQEQLTLLSKNQNLYLEEYSYHEINCEQLKKEMIFLQEPTTEDITIISKIINGKLLFREEINQALKAGGIFIDKPLIDILHWMELQGQCHMHPGVYYSEEYYQDNLKLICHRCGQEEEIYPMECLVCGQQCFYCESCVSMGESRMCRPIYSKPTKDLHIKISTVAKKDFPINFTKAQKAAFDDLISFIQYNKVRALILAVCTARK